MMPNVLDTVTELCRRLDQADIKYTVGGSIASSVWGEPRFTNDADIEVWIDASNAESLVLALGDPYYVSLEEVREAANVKEEFPSFQVMDTVKIFKFDCFVVPDTDFYREAYAKSRQMDLLPGKSVRVACPEKIIIQKLRWYRLGNYASRVQWRDLLVVAKVTDIDWHLIERWAAMFNLEELVEQLRLEARPIQ